MDIITIEGEIFQRRSKKNDEIHLYSSGQKYENCIFEFPSFDQIGIDRLAHHLRNVTIHIHAAGRMTPCGIFVPKF